MDKELKTTYYYQYKTVIQSQINMERNKYILASWHMD